MTPDMPVTFMSRNPDPNLDGYPSFIERVVKWAQHGMVSISKGVFISFGSERSKSWPRLSSRGIVMDFAMQQDKTWQQERGKTTKIDEPKSRTCSIGSCVSPSQSPSLSRCGQKTSRSEGRGQYDSHLATAELFVLPKLGARHGQKLRPME